MSERIIRNAAECPECHEVVESKSVHDYVTCGCGGIGVDGGLDYIRRTYRDLPPIDRSEFAEAVTPVATPVVVSGENERRRQEAAEEELYEAAFRCAYLGMNRLKLFNVMLRAWHDYDEEAKAESALDGVDRAEL